MNLASIVEKLRIGILHDKALIERKGHELVVRLAESGVSCEHKLPHVLSKGMS